MTTTAEKLHDLIAAKRDMKEAIESKGGTVTGGLSTYADAVSRIRTKGDFTVDNKLRFAGSTFTDSPDIDTSNYTNMDGMFLRCVNLENVKRYNTENVVSMREMFAGCSSLKRIDYLDTSSVRNMYGMFSPHIIDYQGNATTYQMQLQSIPLLKAYNVEDVNSMFGQQGLEYGLNELIDIGGFEGLGAVENLSGTDGANFIYMLPNLSEQSIKNIVNNLYDRAAAGMRPLTLMFNYYNHQIDDETIATGTNKGWIITK